MTYVLARRKTTVDTARCPVCDVEIPGEPRFCDQCGARIDPEAPASERRAARRLPLRVEVSFHSDHNFYAGFTGNISTGGLFVATHQPARIGEVLDVSFTVPGIQGICNATCEVRWLREHNPLAPDTVAGLGLRFMELEARARAGIERFARRREPIFFDDDE